MRDKRLKPSITAILAMSADGKISTATHNPARFSSINDLQHLEQQISLCDAIIFGGNTLRAYGTTLTIKNEQLLAQRKKRNQPPQPTNIVCSISGNLDPQCRFFQQPIPRLLLTNHRGFKNWQQKVNKTEIEDNNKLFQDIIVTQTKQNKINWHQTLNQLQDHKFDRIAILGGGELIASICAENLIDDLWLTICPIILGGRNSPTPVGGENFNLSLPLDLLECKQIDQEIFLHYKVK